MKINHEDYEQTTVIGVTGDMTADDLEPLRRLCTDRTGDTTRDFVLDLTGVDFVDSQGLETLLWLQDTAGEQLGQVRLVGLDDNVQTILRVTRLDNRFDVYDDVNSALKSLR